MELSQLQRGIYVVTLMAVAVSVVVFTTPVAVHRILFHEGLKDYIVRYTDRLIIVGLLSLGLGIIGGVVLVLDVLLSRTAAFLTGGALLVVAVMLWVLLPLSKKGRARRAESG